MTNHTTTTEARQDGLSARGRRIVRLAATILTVGSTTALAAAVFAGFDLQDGGLLLPAMSVLGVATLIHFRPRTTTTTARK